MELLTEKVKESPYGTDSALSREIAALPRGLRAMTATHWLDLSLTLDSITWHFGNFGEPGLVAQTEEGLRELGLDALADCFAEAKALMLPLLAERSDDDEDLHDFIRRLGLEDQTDALDQKADSVCDQAMGDSMIYNAWVRYARLHPELVFGE